MIWSTWWSVACCLAVKYAQLCGAQRERVAAQEEAAFEAMWERLEAPSSSESGDEGSEGSGSQDMDEDSD